MSKDDDKILKQRDVSVEVSGRAEEEGLGV